MATAKIAIGRYKSWLPAKYKVSAGAQFRHFAIFGATGSGKSTLMLNLLVQNAAASYRPGMLVLDLKDNLAFDAALVLPPTRERDVVFFDIADTENPPAFNPLANVPAENRTLAAAELVSSFRRLWGDMSWGARMEHVLRHAALTLLETPDATLLDLVRLLTEESYRNYAVNHVSNFSVRHFWETEFSSIVGNRGSVANVESILNKLSILSAPEVRNVLGQSRRGLDIGHAMNNGQIVLAHIPQGVIGEDAASFLAALLVSHVQLASQRRVSTPEEYRRPFLVFADEFQNYDVSSFTKIITEGRSMRVGVLAACQFPKQLGSDLRRTIEHNCALQISCQRSALGYTVDVTFQESRDDEPLKLFALKPPERQEPQQLTFIRARSRKQLGRPRREVEAEIQQRFTREYNHAKRARFFD